MFGDNRNDRERSRSPRRQRRPTPPTRPIDTEVWDNTIGFSELDAYWTRLLFHDLDKMTKRLMKECVLFDLNFQVVTWLVVYHKRMIDKPLQSYLDSLLGTTIRHDNRALIFISGERLLFELLRYTKCNPEQVGKILNDLLNQLWHGPKANVPRLKVTLFTTQYENFYKKGQQRDN